MGTTLFHALLQGGAKPEFAANSFAITLVQQSDENDEISWQAAANFINDCFAAINFKLKVTAEDVQNRLSNFAWPTNEINHYVFLYHKLPFKQFEQFLYKLCLKIQSLTEECAHAQSSIASTWRSPLEWFMQLIAIWNKTCLLLLKERNTKYFNEPIARIDYQLLLGFHILRKLYRDDFPILDNICGRLLQSVLRGVLYQETHTVMITGLTTMLQDDFHLFCNQLNTTANFYEVVLTAKVPKKFHKKIYKSLFYLLETYCLNYEDFNEATNEQHRQNSLEVSNFLINSKMLEVYYMHLTKKIFKPLLINLLDFLFLLQSKVADLACFLDTFMEDVLLLVLDDDNKIGDAAAKFYITVMKRRAEDGFIYTQCFLVYFAYINGPEFLLLFIKRLWKYFGMSQNMDILVEPIIRSGKENEKFRIWGAHFLSAFVKYLFEGYALNRLRIIQLLKKIISYLQSMKCLKTQSILLDIFNILDRVEVANEGSDLKEVLMLFENCAKEKCSSFENWQYPLQKKWFLFFQKAVNYSENFDRLREVILSVSEHCTEVIQELHSHVDTLNADEVHTFSCALQKLSIISQMGTYKINCWDEILIILQRDLLTKPNQSEYSIFCKHANDFKMLIDVYAIELYVIGLIQQFDVQDANNRALTKERVEELERFLREWLQNAELLKKQPIVRIKTYFNYLLGLYITFASSPKNSILTLTISTYTLLVRTLVHVLFKATGRKLQFNEYAEFTEVDPLRSLSYGRSMINHFSELHSARYIEINDHYVWQICLYYALPTAADFKQALHNLLLNLSINRFHIYKRVIPIVIYNLYKQQPPLSEKSIVGAIKAHKSFIDNLDITDRGLLNCHVVFEVIEKIKDTLRISTIAGDRLAPSKHLQIFFKNFNPNTEIVQDMQREFFNLRRSSLRVVERKTLSEFLDAFEQIGADNELIQGTPRTVNLSNR